MKVIQIIARMNKGGTSNWLRHLVIELRKSGVEVVLLSGNVGPGENEDPTFLELGGRRIGTLGRQISPFGDLQSLLALRKIIREENPDIINTHTAKAGFIGRLAAIGLPCKVVHTFHGHLLYGYFTKPKTYIIISLERALSSITDGFIFVGEQVRKDLATKKIALGKKYKVIRPAISGIARNEKFNTLNPHNHKISVGWLGRLTKIKHPERVLVLASELPNIEFLVGGTGDIDPNSFPNLPANVNFLGWMEPEEFWTKCDLGILTSENEGLPTSIIEASSAGIPVVSLNVGSVSEIVEDGITGYLCKDLEDMRLKLSLLSLNNELRTEMGQASINFFKLKFSIEKFTTEHIAFYTTIIELKRPRK